MKTESVIDICDGMELIFDGSEYVIDHDNGDSAPLTVAGETGRLDGGYELTITELADVLRWLNE